MALEPERCDSGFTEFDAPECDLTMSSSRVTCEGCRRPATVCICSYFPDKPLLIRSRILILQHPNEQSRSLATVPLLLQCVDVNRCHVMRGKRFDYGRSKVLDLALSSPDSILLFPGDKALNLCTLPRHPVGDTNGSAVIVIDGTWTEAKSIFNRSPILSSFRQVQLSGVGGSEYSIRTQPTRGSLSTLESVAHILSWLEADQNIIEVLVKPLRAMCRHQLDHGAVRHHSKDDPDYLTREEYKLKQQTCSRGLTNVQCTRMQASSCDV